VQPAYTFKINPFTVPTPVSRVEVVVPVVPNYERNGSFLAISGVVALALAGTAKLLVTTARGSQARRGDLTDAQRDALPPRAFAIPDERKYPIHDERHGQLALVFVAAPSNKRYRYRVMARVFAKYPDLVNFWATTKPGRERPLTAALLRSELEAARNKIDRGRVKGPAKLELENEIDAMQALIRMAPSISLRSLGRRAA
jgi:hypothetical protein